MAGYMGGAMLCIAGAAIALVFGWITASEALVWTSIILSGAAAVLIALGYHSAGRVARRILGTERDRR